MAACSKTNEPPCRVIALYDRIERPNCGCQRPRRVGSRHRSRRSGKRTSPSSIVASGLVEASTRRQTPLGSPVRHDDRSARQPGTSLPSSGWRAACAGSRQAARMARERSIASSGPVSSSAGRDGSRRATATAMPGHGSAARRAHPSRTGSARRRRSARAAGTLCSARSPHAARCGAASLRRCTGWTDAATPSAPKRGCPAGRPAGRARSRRSSGPLAARPPNTQARHADRAVADRMHLAADATRRRPRQRAAISSAPSDEHAARAAGRRRSAASNTVRAARRCASPASRRRRA